MKIDRRNFCRLGVAGAGVATLPSCSAKHVPLIKSVLTTSTENQGLLTIAKSIEQEHNYEAKVEGKLPADLRGTLFRNGPGLFDRAGLRKNFIVDGDGMIRKYSFHDKGVRFENRFIQTQKYKDETKAKEFLYATWTTQAPGGMFNNLFASSMSNQAGVSTINRNGRLYAFDESFPPHILDPETLDTQGEFNFGLPADHANFYSAHSKIDPENGDWIHFGLEYGPSVTVHITIFDRYGKLKKHQPYQAPRYCYMHDFFVSQNYIVLMFHPLMINIFPFLMGRKSFIGSFEWQPEQGNLLWVIPRSLDQKPQAFTAQAKFMWHSFNAFEQGDDLIADFIGYDEPDSIVGPEASMAKLMEGQLVTTGSRGQVIRYRFNLRNKTLTESIILADGGGDFPMINHRQMGRKYRYGYYSYSAKPTSLFFNTIIKIDFQQGRNQKFSFPEQVLCFEPIFVPTGSREDQGWLLIETVDTVTQLNALTILDASNLESGPVANVRLTHHLPLSFHGHWSSFGAT